jgi:hypothetical protein
MPETPPSTPPSSDGRFLAELEQRLAPLTDWIPPDIRDRLDPWVWWLIELVVVLAVLLMMGRIIKGVLRGLFHRRPKIDWDSKLLEDINACPVTAAPSALAIHHIPARIRLLVVAPGGKGVVVEPALLPQLLDRIVPGLGAVVVRDQPRVRIWPAGLSHMGFTNTFHRCTPTGDREDEPSRWVLVAGRGEAGKVPLFVGLGLWTDEPTTWGRLNLEAEEWRGAVQWLNLSR